MLRFWSCQLLLVLYPGTECCKRSNECGNSQVVYMLFARFPVKPQNSIHFVAKGTIGSKRWHIPSSPGHVSFTSFWQKLSKNKSFVKTCVYVCVCVRLTELEAFVLHDNSNTLVTKTLFHVLCVLSKSFCVFASSWSLWVYLAWISLFCLSRDNNKEPTVYFQCASLSLW